MTPYELTLSGPGRNALGSAMLAHVRDGLREAAGRPVLLTGAGGAFSSGLDLKEVASLDRDAMAGFLKLLDETMAAVYTYPGPTVALVRAHAIAGGSVLALCCDRSVGVDDPAARVGLNEVALGLRFPPRILAIVRDRVAPRHLGEVLLGAGLHPPAEAQRLGLLDELAPDLDAAAARAREVLDALARHPPEGYAATKADLRAHVVALAPEAERRFLEEAAPVWSSDAVRARMLAALKR